MATEKKLELLRGKVSRSLLAMQQRCRFLVQMIRLLSFARV